MFKPIETLYEQPGGPSGAPAPVPTPAVDPAPATAPGGTQPGGQQPEKVLFTPEQQAALNALVATERRDTEKRVRESDELKQLRQKAAAFDAEQDTKRTVEERLTAERDAAKAQAERVNARYLEAIKRSAFTTAAITAGIPADRIDGAYQLADKSTVEVDDDSGKVKGINKAIESLPEWVKGSVSGTTGIPGTPRASGPVSVQDRVEQAKQELRQGGRYQF